MARKAKEAAPDPTHNMSAEEIAEKQRECMEHLVANDKELQAEQAKVKGVMSRRRALFKDLKRYGIDREDAQWYLAARRRDPEDIDRETRSRNRIAKLMGLPIGTQLGLFEDGTTVATAAENANPQNIAVDPIQQGKDAAFEGKSRDDCPYPRRDGRRQKWLIGWDQGIEDNVNKTFGPKNGAAGEAVVN